MALNNLDRILIGKMRSIAIPCLRISLGVVFLWFGVLKVLGVSPVAELIAKSYSFFPQDKFIIILGYWEFLIGAGLLFKKSLRFSLFLLWVQMGGVMASLFITPHVFFQSGNPFLLTFEGEFLVKNLVIIAASLVVGGYEVKVD